MKKVLLLSSGTNACYHFAKTVKENFKNQIFIVGADINEKYLIPTCRYLDKFYKVPYSSDEKYYDVILDICKNENIDYILPSFDSDQKLFYEGNADLKNLEVKSLGISREALAAYDNKITMNKFLAENGFKIPRIFDINALEDKVEYFVKPVNGVGSQGALVLEGSKIKMRGDDKIIIQEKCNEPEITLECFCYESDFRSIARERIAAKSGVCTKTRIFNSFELNDIGYRFAKKLKTPYCFNLQFMKNQNDEYVITDVNLRLAGGMSLSAAAGWNEVIALSKIILNKSKDEIFETLPVEIKPQCVVRAYTDIVTMVEKPVIAFDLDGTILDSRNRHQIVLDDILKKHNILLDTSDLIEFKSNNKNNVEYLLSKGIKEEDAKTIQNEWIKHIEDEKYLDGDKLYSDADELLNKYKAYELVLITARSNESGARKQIERLGLSDKFKEIFIIPTGKDVPDKKADILQKEKAVLMVGDTLSDLTASKIANINFEFHENGFHKREVLING